MQSYINSDVAVVTVGKVDPETPTGLTATVGQTLADVTLPEGWTWVAPTTELTEAGTKTFKANFAGDDTHNSVNNVDVTVTVSKANPTAPTGLTATVGQTLADVTLPAGWTWVDSTQSVGEAGVNTFKANFACNDNYNSASNVDVTVTVSEQAVGKQDPVAPTDLTATVGQKLSDVTLPDGWTWVAPTTELTEAGEKTFKANFAGNDNYNSASNVDVKVTVSEASDTPK